MNVLVDTSVWSLALRRKAHQLNPAERSIVVELAELIQEGRARLIGLIRQELLSGIKAVDQYENLRATLRSFPDETVETSDYESAAKGSNACRSIGIAVSAVDALICTIAASRGWPIFTVDPDFENYARILPLKLHAPR
ncbi:MAG TPA: PIN domain-containing protein [Terriglobales bacterium]|nr:PIN domain-containing protein [Terriglobales bacterium]